MTLAEIKRTVLENSVPHGSRIKGSEIIVELNESMVQEIMKVLLEDKSKIVKIRGNGHRDHRSFLEINNG